MPQPLIKCKHWLKPSTGISDEIIITLISILSNSSDRWDDPSQKQGCVSRGYLHIRITLISLTCSWQVFILIKLNICNHWYVLVTKLEWQQCGLQLQLLSVLWGRTEMGLHIPPGCICSERKAQKQCFWTWTAQTCDVMTPETIASVQSWLGKKRVCVWELTGWEVSGLDASRLGEKLNVRSSQRFISFIFWRLNNKSLRLMELVLNHSERRSVQRNKGGSAFL